MSLQRKLFFCRFERKPNVCRGQTGVRFEERRARCDAPGRARQKGVSSDIEIDQSNRPVEVTVSHINVAGSHNGLSKAVGPLCNIPICWCNYSASCTNHLICAVEIKRPKALVINRIGLNFLHLYL